MVEQRKQSFYYKGEEFKYRIQEASLRRFKTETGMSIISEITKGGVGLARVLYYCVCWNGRLVSRVEFENDWKLGMVMTRPGSKREYATSGIIKLLRNAVKKYQLD